MVEAAPAAALVVPEPDFLLEILVVPLDPPAQLSQVDHLLEADLLGQVDSQYCVGSGSPSGHSISSHSSSRGVQVVSGRPSATALTGTGWCCASRRSRVARRPRPDQGLGGKGARPCAQTEVFDRIPAM